MTPFRPVPFFLNKTCEGQTSTQVHTCLIEVGGCQSCLHIGVDIPTGFFKNQVCYIKYVQ